MASTELEDEAGTRFISEDEKIRKHRLETFLEWGFNLEHARALTRARHVPLYDVKKLRDRDWKDDDILRVLL